MMGARKWTDGLNDPSQPALFAVAELPAQPKRRRPGTIKPPKPAERDILAGIKEFLSLHRLVLGWKRIFVGKGWFIPYGVCKTKPHPKAIWLAEGIEGEPDLEVALKNGVTLRIETKTHNGRLSGVQQKFHDDYAKHGHAVGIARSIDDVIALLDQFGVGK